jgi:hypothetical protein
MRDVQPEKVEALNDENMEGKAPRGEGPEPIAIVGMGKLLAKPRLVPTSLT